MRRSRTILAIAGAVAVIAAGGISFAAFGSSDMGSHPAPTTSAAPAASGATLHTAQATVGGKSEQILVDATGLPLYTYEPDTATASKVSGQLAVLWPPLTGSNPTEMGAPGQLSSVKTDNGQQVTYNGHFLYTFVKDQPGMVTGQGVQNFYIATPDLAAGQSGDGDAPPPDTSGY